jgi:hypothetical protein
VNTEQNKRLGDEIICCAYFCRGRALIPILVTLLLLVYFVYGSHETFLKGDYLGMLIFFVTDLMAVLFLLDYLLSDKIIFYRNRVTKIWHAFGSRTIYYSSAKAHRNPESMTESWTISETRLNGKVLFPQIPICFQRRLYSADALEEILSILSDLAGDKTKDFWADKSERQAMIIFGLIFVVLFGVPLVLFFFRN